MENPVIILAVIIIIISLLLITHSILKTYGFIKVEFEKRIYEYTRENGDIFYKVEVVEIEKLFNTKIHTKACKEVVTKSIGSNFWFEDYETTSKKEACMKAKVFLRRKIREQEDLERERGKRVVKSREIKCN